MPRPVQDIKVFGIQDRRSSARVRLPFVVRLRIDGRHRSRSFRTKTEADRYRSELMKAVRDGERFDDATGEPEAWQLPLSDMRIHDWTRHWLATQWPEWQPRTRTSTAESLSRFVALAVGDRVTAPQGLRFYLRRALRPDVDAGEIDAELESWMNRHCLTLAELTRGRVAVIAEELSLKLDGTLLARATSNRFRTNSHDCVLAAVEAGAIPADPWPRRKKSAARKKALRPKRAVNVRQLPAPAVMADAIAAVAPITANGRYANPASRTYQVMTAVAYYAGLRPSEVIMLRPRALTLPVDGWGHIELTEADIDWDEPGEPKTGPRRVPIPPVLVVLLRMWIDERHFVDPDQLLFRTTSGARPSESTWRRAWHRALDQVGQPRLRVYDCRHAAATTWLRAGVPLGEVARRLGHSVQTLVSTYVGALDGDEQIGNTRIQAALTEGT